MNPFIKLTFRQHVAMLFIHGMFLTLCMALSYWINFALRVILDRQVPDTWDFLTYLGYLTIGYVYGFYVWRGLERISPPAQSE